MTRVIAAIILILTLSVGCAYQPVENNQRTSRGKAINAERVLRVEGSSIILGQAAAQPLSVKTLLDTVSSLLAASDHDAASDLLERFPDLARQAMFDSDLVRHRSSPAVAAWLDQQASPARGGWGAMIGDRQQNPSRYARYDQQRRSLWADFRKGHFATNAGFDLGAVSDGPTPWPAIDMMVLSATALLASGNPSDAAPQFEDAAARAQEWDTAFADRQRLFAAFSHRLAGRTIRAEEIEEQVDWLTPSGLSHVYDPTVFRLALKTIGRNPALSGADGVSVRMIHARLGEIELQRGSPQAALLSFRAAESQGGSRPRTAQLRLRQAESLIALRQEQPAIVMLTGLAKSEARPEALAMLGLIYLKRNEIETGISMLQEAVKLTTAESHPEIYADAGLALLSVGQRERGLGLSRLARQSYEQRGDHRAVRQSLSNELSYAESEGDMNLVQQVRRQLTASQLDQ
ncbi:MAG: hypothetical protein AAF194_06130 [Pseudomonadota bacterium]